MSHSRYSITTWNTAVSYLMEINPEIVELQETLYWSRNPIWRWPHCSRRDWIINAFA